jgi:hypothetical protein
MTAALPSRILAFASIVPNNLEISENLLPLGKKTEMADE